LPNLKCFSLHSREDIDAYDELIVPLFQRMLNLEKLDLDLAVRCKNGFIVGKNLRTNIINTMLSLNQFTFHIHSTIFLTNPINLMSNEDLQQSFLDFPQREIISYVDYFPEIKEGQCHIYSYPYQWNEYHKITNNFPGGISKYVRILSLYDQQPFEHEFFIQISNSFPLMKKLTINNQTAQTNKLCKHSSIAKYIYLAELCLTDAHDDYIEEFIIDTKTDLPNDLRLLVEYGGIKRVTERFTNSRMRNNCKKLHSIGLMGTYRIPKYVKEYFSHTEIF
jgi:hypothetical protein